MQTTLNYTNRSKIEKQEVLFSFTEDQGKIPEFNVLFNFDTDAYPPDASVYVEAYHKETRQRFDFGKVSRIVPPEDRKLTELDLSGSIQFRVLIVDESGKHGLLLASGTKFNANSDDNEINRSSILTVKSKPIGQIPWRVQIENGEPPILFLNSSIPNSIEKMRNDQVFQALILPAAFREILTFYLWNEDEHSDEAKKWSAFANAFAEPKPTTQDPSELLAWVDEVVSEFARRFDLSDRLAHNLQEEE